MAAAVDTHDVTTSVYDDVGGSASQPRSVVNCSTVFGLSVTQATAHECHPGSLNDTPSDTQPNASVVDALAPVHLDITILDICLILFLSSLIICVILGNSLVIAAVLLFREMRTLTNALIVSLATADLLVALLVLPISLFFEIADGVWLLGPVVCDFWITTDVFCCTSSILNIVVIALDRYWLITKNVQYTHSTRVPRKRVCIVMTSLAWCTAALIASSPLLGWRAGSEKLDPHLCLISQDYGYHRVDIRRLLAATVCHSSHVLSHLSLRTQAHAQARKVAFQLYDCQLDVLLRHRLPECCRQRSAGEHRR